MMECMDWSANVCSEAWAEVSEYQGRVKALTQEMKEFNEIHSATIYSLKSKSDKL